MQSLGQDNLYFLASHLWIVPGFSLSCIPRLLCDQLMGPLYTPPISDVTLALSQAFSSLAVRKTEGWERLHSAKSGVHQMLYSALLQVVCLALLTSEAVKTVHRDGATCKRKGLFLCLQ